MRGKLWFISGVAVGFVVGARAGRERYDQLVSTARQMWDHPTVQEAAGVMQAQANRLYTEGKETVGDRLSHSRLGEKFSHSGRDQATDRPAAEPLTGTNKSPQGSTTTTP